MPQTTRAVFLVCPIVLAATVYVVSDRYFTPWRLPLPQPQRTQGPLSLQHVIQSALPTSDESLATENPPRTVSKNPQHEPSQLPFSGEEVSQSPKRGGIHHHWKLYGAQSSISVNTSVDQQKQRTNLFSDLLMPDVQGMVERLQSVPISCNSRPQTYQNYMSEKFGKFLQALTNYASFHSQNRGNDAAKKLVWYCGDKKWCGGLGDRSRGVTYALLLSMLSQRILLFHWQDSRLDSTTYLDPNVIDWRLSEKERLNVFQTKEHIRIGQRGGTNAVMLLSIFSQGPKDVSLSDKKLKSVLESVMGSRTWIALRTNMFPSSLVYGSVEAAVDWIKQGMETLGLDKLSPLEINKVMGLAFRCLFTFSKEIVAEIDQARQVLGLNNWRYVGVHLRTGFEGSENQRESNHPKLIKNRKQWEAMLNCAYTHAVDILGKNALLFLATDSHLVKDMALQKYKDRVRTLNDSVIHTEHFKPRPEEVGDYEREGVMSIWVDLVLLAEAHSVIMGRSGYSFLAQSLCFIPQPLLLDGLTCKPQKSLVGMKR